MKIEYVAFDSMGVKSSCVFVKTRDASITIDPGIAVEEDSFPLDGVQRTWLVSKHYSKIVDTCKKSDIIIVTHYHYDHYQPDPALFKGKTVLLKDWKKDINQSQRNRAAELLSIIEKGRGKAKLIRAIDGRELRIGRTKIKFSKPMWHGPEKSKVGYVLMVSIEDTIKHKKLLFTSDLDGPYIEKYANAIIKEKPDVLVMDGFPTYLLGFIASYENLKKVLKNTIKILEKTKCEQYIIDHHLLRDYRYREIYYEVFKRAKELKKNIKTAAEANGDKPQCLLGYMKNGPTRWKNWEKLTFSKLNQMVRSAKAKGRKIREKKTVKKKSVKRKTIKKKSKTRKTAKKKAVRTKKRKPKKDRKSSKRKK
ncbi:MBL fold metallo-hydrolase [Candidatus Woesearchaeota archaeon]|nr:MBL fold metallo-hydrolase [Candidatus Woesearchaeota archaeon]